MKASKIIAIAFMGVALCCSSPMWAQGRGGGGHGGGSSSHGGSHSSSSHSSSMGSSSRSSSSHSSSVSHSSSPSRSSSSVSRSSAPSRSSSSVSRSSAPSRSSSSVSRSSAPSRSSSSVSRSGAPSRPGSSVSRSGAPSRPESVGHRGGDAHRPSSAVPSRGGSSVRGEAPSRDVRRPVSDGRRGCAYDAGGRRGNHTIGHDGRRDMAPAPRYGTVSRPGPMPPSHRPIHPAPYFHHPIHHHMMHMRPVYWYPVPPRPIFWPGFWVYCNSYWYDYHVTNVVVVHDYVRQQYNTDLIAYAISGDLMYVLVSDNDGNNYLQVFDKNDRMLAEQEVSRKYCKMEIDRDNGGCWILKKNDKDPMLFIYTDGQLLIYEAD